MAYLSSDADLRIFLEANGRFAGVVVVEDNGDTGFRDSGLPAFVNQVLQILGSDGAHIGDSKDKTDCIEDIGFA
jgi:hypothetical protein